jgi:hypothetical protein
MRPCRPIRSADEILGFSAVCIGPSVGRIPALIGRANRDRAYAAAVEVSEQISVLRVSGGLMGAQVDLELAIGRL